MSQNTWLSLTDYSSKHKVSVSTLRRRIKTETINFRLDDGKYFISDEPVKEVAPPAHRPSQVSETKVTLNDGFESSSTSNTMLSPSLNSGKQMGQSQKEEPILTAANKLLNELKKAYSLILHEKEEQILQLREEAADLKTLVRVLESENERLQSKNK